MHKPMIDKAKELAERAGLLDKISFVKGALVRLMGGKEEIEEYERGGTPWYITYTFIPVGPEGILHRLGEQ